MMKQKVNQMRYSMSNLWSRWRNMG